MIKSDPAVKAMQAIVLGALLISACGSSSGTMPSPTSRPPAATPTATATPRPSPTTTTAPPTATAIPLPIEGEWGDGPLDAPVQLMVYSDFQ